jgi:hypothetical protein
MDFDMTTVGWIVAGGFALGSYHFYMKMKFNEIYRSMEDARRDFADMVRGNYEDLEHQIDGVSRSVGNLYEKQRNCCKDSEKSFYNSNA